MSLKKLSLFCVTLCLLSMMGFAEVAGAIENTSSEAGKSLNIQVEVIQQEEALQDIQEIQKKTKLEEGEAVKRKVEAEKKMVRAKTETDKALIGYLNELEAYRLELTQSKLQVIKQRESQLNELKDLTQRLVGISAKINSKTDLSELRNYFDTAVNIWRKIVDETINSLFDSTQVEVPPMPKVPESITLKSEIIKGEKQKIINARIEIEQQQASYTNSLKSLLLSEKEIRTSLLLKAGRVRSDLMAKLISSSSFSVWDFAGIDLMDYPREVKIVPYRFIATILESYYEVKAETMAGLRGWIELIKQIIILLFVLAMPIIFFKLFKKFSKYLDGWRSRLFLRSSISYKARTSLSVLINKVNPYLPWIFIYISVSAFAFILKDTALDPVALFVPYAEIYIFYRVFNMAFAASLGRILLSKKLDKIRAKQPEVRATAKKLSVLFFVQWVVLHAVQDTVRKALIYNLIFDVVIVLDVFIIAFETRKWRTELLAISKKWLKFELVNFIEMNSNSFTDLFIMPFVFFGDVVFLIAGWFYAWLSKFEFGKKLSSEIYKRKLEEAADGSRFVKSVLPLDYKSLFEEGYTVPADSRVQVGKSPLKQCTSHVINWQTGAFLEDLLVLYGNYGIGKTTTLQLLSESLTDVDVRYIKYSEKLIQPQKFYIGLSKLLGIQFSNVEEFAAAEKNISKTVVMIDNIHNLYLNTVNGLGVYRTLIELMSVQTENIFWCLTCNERAWVHLKGLFGSSHFLGPAIELKQWSDEEIQDLILKRHEKSGYRLRFDRVISAVHNGEMLDVSGDLEAQFFRLLWGQSRGNPRTAQELWLSATSLIGEKTINVTVPGFTKPGMINDANNNTLLVLAALAKHESLSTKELADICSLPMDSIKHSLKYGEDRFLIQSKRSNVWMLHPRSQYVVQSQLIGKNFIYE